MKLRSESVGRTNELTLIVTNSGGGLLTVLIGSDDPVNPAVAIPLVGNGVGGSSAGSLSLSTTSLPARR